MKEECGMHIHVDGSILAETAQESNLAIIVACPVQKIIRGEK